jgi:hypothetical protein
MPVPIEVLIRRPPHTLFQNLYTNSTYNIDIFLPKWPSVASHSLALLDVVFCYSTVFNLADNWSGRGNAQRKSWQG